MTDKKPPKQIAAPAPKAIKLGPIEPEEAEFIVNHIKTMRVKDIAVYLNRRLNTIYKFLERNKIPVKAKVRVDPKEEAGTEPAVPIEAETYAKLKTKTFYKNLKQQLTSQELDYFVDHWIDLVKQFNGDLAPSEEMELKELLILEILKNRETASEFTRLQQADELQRQLRDEMALGDDRDKEKIQSLTMQISQLKVASSTYSWLIFMIS